MDERVKIQMPEKIRAGESVQLSTPLPVDAEIGKIVIGYDDEFGNKYETMAVLNFKERRIVKQEYKIIEKVKDLGGEIPKLVIEEDSIHWPEITKTAKLPNLAFYGILMIILGIITWIVTYRYVVPTGSMFLIGSGLFLIFVRIYGRYKDRQIYHKRSE